MDRENLDLKTAIQIAKIVVTVPEERMPIIWDIFKQAGLDIGGVDEMAEWKALTKQAFLIDTEKFLAGAIYRQGHPGADFCEDYREPAGFLR